MQEQQEILLDPGIRDWVLLPIMLVMVLVGILRHYVTLLLASHPKPTRKAVRESQAISRSVNLRTNANVVPFYAFENRRNYLAEQFIKGTFLKTPPSVAASSTDPNEPQLPPQLQDPEQAEQMMDGMKKNMFMMVPQMLIMGWVSTFFSGFVLSMRCCLLYFKLPFALTLRFKPMLQRGVETPDMDVSWVSSLSWYFINLLGLRGVFGLLLGEGNSADGMKDMGMAAMPQQQPMGQPVDMTKVFESERESLELVTHEWLLADIEVETIKNLANDLAEYSPTKKTD